MYVCVECSPGFWDAGEGVSCRCFEGGESGRGWLGGGVIGILSFRGFRMGELCGGEGCYVCPHVGEERLALKYAVPWIGGLTLLFCSAGPKRFTEWAEGD